MRPQRLVINAFGSYAHRQEIDFNNLGEHRCFLIHGPIGSGKSTILDAICFALYGRASGDNRSPELMRSDHAAPSDTAFVTLDFTLGSEAYRVTRRPRQERAKKRGGGTTTISASATLWKRTGLTDLDEDGQVMAHQSSKVTEAVEDLLGFRLDQFRQVVILPQGQFRRLLTARSAERQAIMETLFQTEIYRRVEDFLKADARTVATDLEKVRVSRQLILEQSGASAQIDLEAQCKQIKQDVAGAIEARQESEAAATKAQQALAQGRAVAEILRQRDERHAQLGALQDEIPQIDAVRNELDAARRAATVRPSQELAQNLEEQSRAASSAQEAHIKETLKADQAHQKAHKALEAAKKRVPELEEARRQLRQLQELRQQVERLGQAQQAHQRDQKALESSAKRLKDAQAALQSAEAQLGARRIAATAAGQAAAEIPALTERTTTLRQQLQARHDLDTALDQDQLLTQALEHQRDNLKRLEGELEQERQELVLIEAAWMGGQAAILASKLNSNKPCPVCGSSHHPAPAKSDEALPTQVTVERKRQRLERLGQDQLRLSAELKTQASAHQSNQEHLKHLQADCANLPSAEVLQERLAVQNTALEAARASADALQTLRPELEAAQAHTQTLRQAADTQRLEHERAAASAAASLAIVQERQTNIPEHLHHPNQLEAAVTATQEAIAAISGTLEAAQERHREAQERQQAASTALDRARGALSKARQLAQEARRAYDTARQQAGFDSMALYTDAGRPASTIDLLQARLQDFDGRLAAAQREANRADELSKGLQRPDMDALKAAEETHRAAHEAAIEQVTALGKHLELTQERPTQLEALNQTLRIKEARYAIIGRLSKVASGRNELRMTFQRFVLTALLDEVLERASRRLRVMSNQRYDLRRAHDPEDHRAAGGLELEVHDSYTGTCRNVITLSGGESFLAALSLALGLADVVQSYAGGIRLEAIFIDEGFGSLDSEAIELALNALLDLQAGGRMVGIISHVPEIKERIAARLEITRGPTGSTAAFQL